MIVANWKMHFNLEKAVSTAHDIKAKLCDSKVNIVVCPPFLYLTKLKESFESCKIKLGAQNLYFEDEGAYTGEVSAMMLKSVGCSYVIVGHSERRNLFNESDFMINKKLKSALAHSLLPILCIGETLEQRQMGKTFNHLKDQLAKNLQDINGTVIIAYEPIWAIGSGNVATLDQIFEVHSFIKDFIKTKVLYGGSVNPQNAYDIGSLDNVDGFLVGGASLETQKFEMIANKFEEAKGVV